MTTERVEAKFAQSTEEVAMGRKTVRFSENGVGKLPNDKPVVYKIKTEGGKVNYVGVAKRGRVQDRIQEHLDKGKIPGAKVQVQQAPSIQEAERIEARLIARAQPRYNKEGK